MPEATEGPTVLRILLGMQLRRLRESRGISAQAAAKAIRGSESKISRIELGRNAIREIDVLDLLTFYGVGPAEQEQLLTLAEQANRPGWWHRFNDILPDWFQSYVGMEEAATSIRVYEPQFVPGLLQIPTYTAAVLAVCDIPLGEAERHVILRKERQRRFLEGRLKLWAIIEETALRRPVGSTEILRDQLRYLLSLSDRPNFTLQIIPWGMGGHAVPSGFTILRFAEPDLPDVAYLEHLTGALYFDKKSDVDRYLLAMERLSIVAAKPSHAPGILTAIIDELEKELANALCPALGMSFPAAGTRSPDVRGAGWKGPAGPGAYAQETGRSNSPFLAPMRKHSHSCRLNTCGVLARSFESRTATPPSGRCAISTHPAALLALLLNQSKPSRSVSIRPLLSG
jgi:transcriptional regulator with XRE-family HTH domain